MIYSHEQWKTSAHDSRPNEDWFTTCQFVLVKSDYKTWVMHHTTYMSSIIFMVEDVFKQWLGNVSLSGIFPHIQP
jgi:hypothetical protein